MFLKLLSNQPVLFNWTLLLFTLAHESNTLKIWVLAEIPVSLGWALLVFWVAMAADCWVLLTKLNWRLKFPSLHMYLLQNLLFLLYQQACLVSGAQLMKFHNKIQQCWVLFTKPRRLVPIVGNSKYVFSIVLQSVWHLVHNYWNFITKCNIAVCLSQNLED